MIEHNHTSCISRIFVLLLIPFLFLLGLILAYFHIFPLKVEIHTLVIVGFIFMIFVFFARHNANYTVCKMRNNFFNMEENLQDALDENALTIMGKTKSTLQIHAFIKEYYKDIRNDNFARIAPSVFPMLGILGTFIAIAFSMPDFSAKDTSSLDHEISILLSGIGTAFYASIYGILLSLIWTYFEKRGISKADKQIYELEKLYDNQIWKKSELIKHEHMQSELKDQQIVETLKETFNMNFIKELNEQYVKNFTSIIHEMSGNFKEITEQMQDVSSDLRHTLGMFEGTKKGVSAISLMEENIEGFNSNAESLQKSMERFDDSVEHTFDNIDRELGTAVEKLTTFARILSEQNRHMLKYMAEIEQTQKNIEK